MVSTAFPRVVIAAPASSQGKTTVAIGLMSALARQGKDIAGFKVGPDYIDPGYHALACGRPGRNLDPYLCGAERIAPLFCHGALTPRPAELSVIEGVMGLFDGLLGTWPDGTDDPAGFGSTAHIARLLDAPIVLVIDGSHSARTAAALCHGLATFDPRIRVGGVILNRVMGTRVVDEVTHACERVGLPVLGAIPTQSGASVGSRHLGLITAQEQGDARHIVERAGDLVAAHVDLAAITELAQQAGSLDAEPWNPQQLVTPVSERPVIAMASGPAFTFRYRETEELLRAAGCRVIDVDPLTAPSLPAGTAGLYLGGGFPEEHATALAANTSLHHDIRDRIARGMPTIAECAGLLYLCRSLDGLAMVGAIGAEATMTPRLTIGYHEARALGDSFLMSSGEAFRAHEFHRTQVQLDSRVRPDSRVQLISAADNRTGSAQFQPAWSVPIPSGGQRAEGVLTKPGSIRAQIHASYQHLHWAGEPELAQRFAQAASDYITDEAQQSPAQPPADSDLSGAPDLEHHGDLDAIPGAIDLAVNVRAEQPPQWLLDQITAVAHDWARYPDMKAAQAAVAARHGVNPDQVLITAGSSQAFDLIARAFTPHWAVVVHPQFTEPELALRRAGRPVGRHVLHSGNGFVLDPDGIEPRADLVVVGNPTNPTGVLHETSDLRGLVRPGRVVVVDEAFMDAVPGEPQSVIAGSMTGLLVTRSFTKTWSIPGLRIGYVVGDATLIAQLASQQACWPVSSPALVAAAACSSSGAVAMAQADAVQLTAELRHFRGSLEAIGVHTVADSAAPFLLADLRRWPSGPLRTALRQAGYAVRGCETFPGLGAGWLRLAVRSALVVDAFVATLAHSLDALSTDNSRPDMHGAAVDQHNVPHKESAR